MTIRNELAPLANGLWTATARPAEDFLPLGLDATADVAIVGGGFTGLSAALHLAERGVSVVLLEAEQPGWGASGRNGGQVIPGLKEDPEAIERIYGPGMGRRVNRLAAAAPDLVFDLIDKHGIACDAVRGGWLQPAHDAAGLRTQQARVEQLQARGAPVELLDRAATAQRLGTSSYLGGMLDPRGGAVHPFDYATGLAAAAARAGARLHGNSPVRSLGRSGSGWRLRTAGGSVTAGKVLLCTNGYTDALLPALARSVIAVRSVQVATEPLPQTLRAGMLEGGLAASDTRRLLVYFRLDAHGRLLIGGRGAQGEKAIEAAQERLRRRAVQLYPQVAGARWAHHWGGYVALTEDHLPHLHEPQPGLVTGLGYNGRGVAMATAMGRVLAERAAGAEPADLDFPVTGLREVPFHALRRPIVGTIAAWYAVRDRLSF
ncbi:FAD-binding oxidoreductase [Geminicoccaceae bacterium 1502E]|nr:FAD-binding oxidoreductase [Geminicoccaceae bacterium 1502E]